MPPLSEDEAIDVATIYSVAGRRAPRFGERPFRDPHHTASTAALVGGGNPPLPGEISMAHHGVLFLDELPEFQRDVLEALREPLESGEIVVARVNASTRYPAKFQLVAAMNPCPAGLVCDETRCRCTPSQVQRYRARISGPLLDRIDIHVEVGPVSEEEFWDKSDNDEGDSMRHLVQQTFKRQIERYGKSSRDFDTRELKSACALAAPELDLLKRAVQRFKLSARAIHRVQKLARTIADMEGEDQIHAVHLSEALTYRGPYFEPLM
jgi:magnesium chelatase family protein